MSKKKQIQNEQPQSTPQENEPPKAKPPEETEQETIEVLALVDNKTFGLKCGQIHNVPVDVVDQLVSAGVVDGEQAAIASGKRPEKEAD
ncbi:hypothetical protein [Reinekea sp.]|jgi:hypothetical protein|uniref:hypothetical protein n=1 Tax=Reinekea sp. TaxID=1970455 RepID=UPI00398A08B5